MSSDKLRKYLAYYRKVLREEPGNIEARLRLASLYRDMGRPEHAVDEYVAAARLLASQGLPLEAIAACKAILELEPSHTDTQFFLARLYAQAPEATGGSVRVARPVEDPPSRTPPATWSTRATAPVTSAPAASHADALPTFTLDTPKVRRQHGAVVRPAPPAAPEPPSSISALRARLPEIPLFSQLGPAGFMKLLEIIDVRHIAADTVVLDPDDERASLFVIVRGRARVEKPLADGRTVTLAILGEGEFFGEFRLLTGRDGLARVVAQGDLEVLEIRDEVLYELAATNPEVWDALWNFYYARMLNNLLASSPMFNRLAPDERTALARRFALEEVLADAVVLEQDRPCPGIFLVVSGEVIVEQANGPGGARLVDVLREGDFFGVAPAATSRPCSATVRAHTDTVVLRLPAEVFRDAIRRHDVVAREVDRVVRERRHRTDPFARGTTSYAELGIVNETE